MKNIEELLIIADKKLIDYIERKIEGLEKFHDKIVDAEVFLKVQKPLWIVMFSMEIVDFEIDGSLMPSRPDAKGVYRETRVYFQQK